MHCLVKLPINKNTHLYFRDSHLGKFHKLYLCHVSFVFSVYCVEVFLYVIILTINCCFLGLENVLIFNAFDKKSVQMLYTLENKVDCRNDFSHND